MAYQLLSQFCSQTDGFVPKTQQECWEHLRKAVLEGKVSSSNLAEEFKAYLATALESCKVMLKMGLRKDSAIAFGHNRMQSLEAIAAETKLPTFFCAETIAAAIIAVSEDQMKDLTQEFAKLAPTMSTKASEWPSNGAPSYPSQSSIGPVYSMPRSGILVGSATQLNGKALEANQGANVTSASTVTPPNLPYGLKPTTALGRVQNSASYAIGPSAGAGAAFSSSLPSSPSNVAQSISPTRHHLHSSSYPEILSSPSMSNSRGVGTDSTYNSVHLQPSTASVPYSSSTMTPFSHFTPSGTHVGANTTAQSDAQKNSSFPSLSVSSLPAGFSPSTMSSSVQYRSNEMPQQPRTYLADTVPNAQISSANYGTGYVAMNPTPTGIISTPVANSTSSLTSSSSSLMSLSSLNSLSPTSSLKPSTSNASLLRASSLPSIVPNPQATMDPVVTVTRSPLLQPAPSTALPPSTTPVSYQPPTRYITPATSANYYPPPTLPKIAPSPLTSPQTYPLIHPTSILPTLTSLNDASDMSGSKKGTTSTSFHTPHLYPSTNASLPSPLSGTAMPVPYSAVGRSSAASVPSYGPVLNFVPLPLPTTAVAPTSSLFENTSTSSTYASLEERQRLAKEAISKAEWKLEDVTSSPLHFSTVSSYLARSNIPTSAHASGAFQQGETRFVFGIRELLLIRNNDLGTRWRNFQASKSTLSSPVEFVFHGTSQSNARDIAAIGFNSAFSKRNLFGQGHYFALLPHIAAGYTQDFTLLICQILADHRTVVDDDTAAANAAPSSASSASSSSSNTATPKGYIVVKEDDAILPTYILTFSVKPK